MVLFSLLSKSTIMNTENRWQHMKTTIFIEFDYQIRFSNLCPSSDDSQNKLICLTPMQSIQNNTLRTMHSCSRVEKCKGPGRELNPGPPPDCSIALRRNHTTRPPGHGGWSDYIIFHPRTVWATSRPSRTQTSEILHLVGHHQSEYYVTLLQFHGAPTSNLWC